MPATGPKAIPAKIIGRFSRLNLKKSPIFIARYFPATILIAVSMAS